MQNIIPMRLTPIPVVSNPSTFGNSNNKDNGFATNIIILEAKEAVLGKENNTELALVYWQLDENDAATSSNATGTSYTQRLSHGYGVVGNLSSDDSNVSYQSGTSTFTGKSIGSYIPEGEVNAGKLTKSNISATINFNSNTGTITSSGTAGRGVNDGEDFSELNFTGTIPNFAGKNKVSGTVQNTDSSMQGTMDARFYHEFTRYFLGTFELRGQQGVIPATYIGAFTTNR